MAPPVTKAAALDSVPESSELEADVTASPANPVSPPSMELRMEGVEKEVLYLKEPVTQIYGVGREGNLTPSAFMLPSPGAPLQTTQTPSI